MALARQFPDEIALVSVCYPEASLPAWAVPVLANNPIYVLVKGCRAVFLEGRAPASGSLWKLWILSAAVLTAGRGWFCKLRRSFADIIWREVSRFGAAGAATIGNCTP